MADGAVGADGTYEAVARRTRSRNRIRSAANTPPESDEEDIVDRPRGRKRRSTSRQGAAAADVEVVTPSGGRPKRRSSDRDCPAKKRSRTQSRDRLRGLDVLPPPPPRKDDKNEDDEVLKGYIKDIAQLHRDHCIQQSHHGCFGQKGETSLRGIHAVARGGKLPTSCLPRGFHRRWGSKYPPGYFDSDPAYYSDPEKLNPPKKPNASAARAAVSEDEDKAGPSGLQSQKPPSPSTPPVVEFRAVTRSAGSSGALEVTIANDDRVDNDGATAADDDVLDIHADESDLLATPILRKTRSFEDKESSKSVRINMGGVQFYVLKGDTRGVREDRRGPYTIDRKEKQARVKNERARMSDEDEIASINAEEARKEEKAARKRERWATLNDERLQYIRDNNIYCNLNGDECSTGEGVDAFIGEQAWQIDGCAEIMAREMVTNASLVAVKPPTWQATVDAVSAIEEGFVARFSNEKPGIDPSVDLSLVRAREMRRLNGLWAYVFTKAIAEAERIAGERLDIDQNLIKKWLEERTHGSAANVAIAAVEPTEAEVVEISDDDSDTSSADSGSESDTYSTCDFSSETAAEIYTRSIEPDGGVAVEQPPDAGAAVGNDEPEVAARVEADPNESVPWEDFHVDAPADIIADADAAGLSRLDQNKLAFLANVNHRVAQYQESGFAEDYLYRQLTMG